MSKQPPAPSNLSAPSEPRSGQGVVSIVGTPIGNLSDITARALETLKSADMIVAEDTRQTKKLLSHFGIPSKRLVAIHAHSSPRDLERVTSELTAGAHVALVTDAGMPSISDPGASLIRKAAELGSKILVVPGPSAVTAAAALSGLVSGPFLFLGFLPRKGRARKRAVERIAKCEDPVILFEAANRLTETLAELAETAGERSAAVCRELTKVFEQTVRGSVEELARLNVEWRGEVTVVIAGSTSAAGAAIDDEELDQRIAARVMDGQTVRSIVDELETDVGLSRRELYAHVQAMSERTR